MGKTKDKEDDNVFIEFFSQDDVSNDSEDVKGFISIYISDDTLPIFEGRHLDKFGYKETLQAGDTIRYTKSNGIAGRKSDLEITEIMSVYPEKEYPLVLTNNAKLTATREN
jgi:hypothetical protein